MNKLIASIIWMLLLAFAIFTATLYAYFFACYHIAPGYWPWQVWWGVPCLIVYTFIAAILMALALACFSIANDGMTALKPPKPNTEKRPDGYEQPISTTKV